MTGNSEIQNRPQKVHRGEHVVAYTITVNAPAEELYAMASNPHRHQELDGSETVRDTAVGPRELFQGDRFRVDMNKFGVNYALTSVVTEAEAPHVVEWRHPAGHHWRWEFTPVAGDPSRTVVTESYDARGQKPLVRRGLSVAKVPADNANGIKASLQKLHDRYAG
jgi:uncharacterized protein YndB with AHSA1/START domain